MHVNQPIGVDQTVQRTDYVCPKLDIDIFNDMSSIKSLNIGIHNF